MSEKYTLPETGMVREKTVLKHIAPVSRSTLWRWRRAGKFPAPRQMGDGASGYRAEDLRLWLDSRQEVHA